MKPLVQEDLIPFTEYERQREPFRRRVIDLKRRRRIALGEHVTLVFENRETIQFQIQEMIRVERILDPAKVQEELDVYNALLPGGGELSATLLIEITESERIQTVLDTFRGIDRGETLALQAGPSTVYGEFEGGHSNEEKISAVHFVKFRPDLAFLDALASKDNPVRIRLRHGVHQAEVDVPADLREEWLADLGSSAERP